MKQLLLVFLGGGFGSSLRYFISKYLNDSQLGVPYGTFFVNILGCLIIGFLLGFAFKYKSISNETMLLLATGFCGGFTTFSAFAYENYIYFRSGDYIILGLYTTLSLIFGIAAVILGIWMVRFT
jgi:CrcB protein